MPPMTSSRAGTRVTQISPAPKKLARPEASLLGLHSNRSNSETSNGNSSFTPGKCQMGGGGSRRKTAGKRVRKMTDRGRRRVSSFKCSVFSVNPPAAAEHLKLETENFQC